MNRHPVLYKFDSRALCRDVSSRELSAKIPSLPLALEMIFLQSLPETYDHR